MPTLIVAATSPGAGKTAITAAIADHLASGGRSVISGQAWSNASDSDIDSLRSVLGDAITVQKGAESHQVDGAAALIKQAAGQGGIVVIEGKTGDSGANLDLAEATDALVLLVAKAGDDILPAASSYGSRLAGVIINNVPRYRSHELESRVIPALNQANITVIGWIPEDRRLIAPTLRAVADHVGGEIVANEENADRLIDNFLIGGMVLDWGPFYFGSQENVGVVVRGDRPDVQLAALQTDTVRAMVLTKGARPVEYVVYEASQRGVPIVQTSGTTEETAALLEGLLEKIRFDHPDKLARMRDIASERLDLAALDAVLSQPATR
jgi:BioD-like phosphotransacetylase family protein